MTAEELELVAATKKAHRARYCRNHRNNKKSKDPDACRANDLVTKNAWAAKNRDRVNPTAARVQSNALTSNRLHRGSFIRTSLSETEDVDKKEQYTVALL
jgi:hypothetical protein